jgi:HlyD family secretion protein
VHTGDLLARFSAVELTAQADQARAALASATANRNNVYAGVRREQVDSLKAAISKAGARLEYVQAQLTRTSTLARQSFKSQQSLDQADNHVASPYRRRVGPGHLRCGGGGAYPGGTCDRRRAGAGCCRRGHCARAPARQMVLRAPADGVVTVIAAEVGENVRAGQPILMVEAAGRQWLSFNVREDHLNRLSMGETARVKRNGADGAIKAGITELRQLGTFAIWRAERVIGDHDRNTLRLRLEPRGEPAGFEPGMTVWIEN